VPPAHAKPAGQGAPLAFVLPAAQKAPGAAVHGPLQALVDCGDVAPKKPAAQGVGVPSTQKDPAGHAEHVSWRTRWLEWSLIVMVPVLTLAIAAQGLLKSVGPAIVER